MKLYKDAYIWQESFAMTDKSYPPPCRNFLQPFYLSVTLYACAQRDVVTPTDSPKLVRILCVIELLYGPFVSSRYLFDISVGIGAYVIGLSHISFFKSNL